MNYYKTNADWDSLFNFAKSNIKDSESVGFLYDRKNNYENEVLIATNNQEVLNILSSRYNITECTLMEVTAYIISVDYAGVNMHHFPMTKKDKKR